jgi:hypothetical protein
VHAEEKAAKKFRWPWEQPKAEKIVKKTSDSEDEEDGGGSGNDPNNKSLDSELALRLKPRGKRNVKNLKLSSQKFAYNKTHGYIYSVDKPNLVFGVMEGENGLNEVFLQKKSEENINQRWLLRPSGVFLLKGRNNMALTVKLPPIEVANIDLIADDDEEKARKHNRPFYNETSIVIQPLVEVEHGNAHQRFFVDENTGFIYAFAVSDMLNIGEFMI